MMVAKNDELENIKDPNGVLLEDLLGGNNRVFEIPLFQRNYNWTEDNCRELYDDIIDSYYNKLSHFIGIFMYYTTESTSLKISNILIDGQQRLTTIMLLLCAIREVTDDKKLKENINNLFIYNKNNKIKFRFKLKQNNFDNYNFEKVLDGDLEKIQLKSTIYRNYSKFVSWLSDSASKLDMKLLFEHIKKMEAVEIILKGDNIEKVQTIFEKINSTGQPLTPADLIRNYLLFTGDMDEQQQLYDKWTLIEKIVGVNKITNFVRAYTIRYTFENVVVKNTYSDFKKFFRDKKHNVILDDMIKNAIYYSIIENSTYYTYDSSYNLIDVNNTDNYFDNTLKMLEAIGTDDWVPLFMQLFDLLYKENKSLLGKILELILEFMIRYRVVQPSAGGGALQVKIYDLMESIKNKTCSLTVKSVYDKLSNSDKEASRFPTDAQFISHLKENMLPKNGRVLLFQYSRRRGLEGAIDFNPNLTLEHLMPQTINPDDENGKWWISNLGKTKYKLVQEKYTECIGNYALLTRSLNASISNASWPNKRKEMMVRAYDNETKRVASESKWNESSIKDRNDRFSNEIRQYITGPRSEKKNDNKWLI